MRFKNNNVGVLFSLPSDFWALQYIQVTFSRFSLQSWLLEAFFFKRQVRFPYNNLPPGAGSLSKTSNAAMLRIKSWELATLCIGFLHSRIWVHLFIVPWLVIYGWNARLPLDTRRVNIFPFSCCCSRSISAKAAPAVIFNSSGFKVKTLQWHFQVKKRRKEGREMEKTKCPIHYYVVPAFHWNQWRWVSAKLK